MPFLVGSGSFIACGRESSAATDANRGSPANAKCLAQDAATIFSRFRAGNAIVSKMLIRRSLAGGWWLVAGSYCLAEWYFVLAS
jgi:hypothetical protein